MSQSSLAATALLALAGNRSAQWLILVASHFFVILEDSSDNMPVQLEEKSSSGTIASLPRPNQRRTVIMLIVLACVAFAMILAVLKWPFNRDAIVTALRQQSGGEVQVGSFRNQFWPKPGCVVDQVTFRHPGDQKGQPYLTIQRLAITTSFAGLLTNHLDLIRADNFHVQITPSEQSSNAEEFNVGKLSSGLTIGKVVADGAQIEFLPTPERNKSLIYRIPKLVVHDLADGKPLHFQGTLQIPQPAAEVAATGEIWPWKAGHGGESKLSGSYDLKSLDLGSFDAVGGIVTSQGTFSGVLQHADVQGTAETPNFTTSSSGHKVHITSDFNATVNGLNGDVYLNAARVHYGHTTITGAGSVVGQQGVAGKVASFELSSRDARVQDLVWMFISENQPPMTGPVVFRAKATINPGKQPFLNRVKLVGDFGISDAQYSHPDTQKNIDVLSARARGEADKVEDTNDKFGGNSYDPGRVVANIKGHVVLSDTIAHLSDVSFAVPGALAKVNGTYGLMNHRINLHGDMQLDSELSKTTTGVQSFLLKLAHPFMKKSHHNASVVAIKIGGTYENPTYTVVPKREK